MDSSIRATVDLSQRVSQVNLENTGRAELHRVKVMSAGKDLGILSKLVPGEKKVLAVSGHAEEITVKALDPSDREIQGTVQYAEPAFPIASFSSAAEDAPLSTLSAPESAGAFAGQTSEVTDASAATSQASPASKSRDAHPLALSISTNKTEGREGDIVGFRCVALNNGIEELSQIKIFCGGRMASTNFLPPGKELYLDGALAIRDNFELSAGAEGKDGKGQLYTNNTSVAIWKVSPEIGLTVDAPHKVHRNDIVTLRARVENSGSGNLTDVTVSDSFGEMGRLATLGPGAFQVLQKERIISESLHGDVAVLAHDGAGREVYASRSLDIKVLNSSLQIEGQPSEVRSYPGEPAEVTWTVSNTGEEPLKNITLSGDGKGCTLLELSPGRSVRMAAIYNKTGTTRICVMASGVDETGFAATANASVLLKAIMPGINLKVMPPQLEVCPGETADMSALVTNTGDDALTDVVITQNGSILATLDRIEAGEFKVVDSRTVISANSTIQFDVAGKDSRGQTWSDAASVRATTVISALKVFVSASPPTAVPGSSVKLTCTVANTGSVPLYSIFVISKEYGPLGNIDFLAPKRQMMVQAARTVEKELDDTISAEGFTQEKSPVRGSCHLHVGLLNVPGLKALKPTSPETPVEPSATRIVGANISCGNTSLALSLPPQEETARKASGKVAQDVDLSATKSNNMILDGISNLLRYVEKILGKVDEGSQSSAAREFAPQAGDGLSAGKDYELSIAGVKDSEHGAISILDVSSSPSQPAAGETVKITVHIKSPDGIKSASLKYGLSDSPLTKQDLLGVKRVYNSPLVLESGNSQDGYWSGTIPGKEAGVYMALSAWMTDGVNVAEGGPYMLHWSTVNSAQQGNSVRATISSGGKNGMLFIESSSVTGHGEVSIKDTFQGSSMNFHEKMIGNGSISLETLRCIDQKNSINNFTEKKDLVFTGGNLKGHQTVDSPRFHGGLGASVTERFNLSHVDRSETSSLSSINPSNNTLAFKTEQAFDGTWNIQTKYAKFYKKIKADQQYTGSFQTEKDIKFQDAGQS